MIQRLQSVLLLVVVVLGILLFYFPLFSFSVSNNENGNMNTFMITDNVILSSLTILIIILALITIFLFNSRQLQIKLCGLQMLLLSVLVVAVFYVEGKLNEGDVKVKYTAGSYFILASLILLWLSIRFIRKDDELVRSADRLR